MRSFVGLAAGLAALVVLAGCGGSSMSSSTRSTSSLSSGTPGATNTTSATSAASTGFVRCDPEPCQLTHAELAAKLDSLCVRGNTAVKRADARFEQATNASDYTNAAALMATALREFPPYQDVIQGITPSAQEQAAFTRYVDLTRRIHGLSTQIVAAGRARDTPAVIRLSRLVREASATRTRTAVDLGTKHCDA